MKRIWAMPLALCLLLPGAGLSEITKLTPPETMLEIEEDLGRTSLLPREDDLRTLPELDLDRITLAPTATPEPIVTPEPITPEPATPVPLTPESVTPDPVTPEPVTPEPTQPAEITSEPIVTPAPLEIEQQDTFSIEPELRLSTFLVRSPQKGSPKGSTGSISGAIEATPGKEVLVILRPKGETLGVTQTCTSTNPEFSFNGLAPGEYTLTIRYKDGSGIPLTLTQSIEGPGSTATPEPAKIVIAKAIIEDNTILVRGTADPLSAVTIGTLPASMENTVASDASGSFSVQISASPKTYNAVWAQYGANTASRVVLHGTFKIEEVSTAYPTFGWGDRYDPLIYQLQQRLRDLGYYTIRVDGIYGSGTERAVRLFQQNNGLPVTGVANDATQRKLYSGSAKPYTGSAPAETSSTLRRSSAYQPAVVPLQRRLRELGYFTSTVDGYFGSRTARAVRAFQQRNGLSVTGEADPVTQQRLYASSARPASGGGSGGSSGGSAVGYRLLYWGTSGAAVSRLQSALLAAGYKQVRVVDGIYGRWTYDAVRAFQKNHGLSVDGIAGRKTQNALYGTHY